MTPKIPSTRKAADTTNMATSPHSPKAVLFFIRDEIEKFTNHDARY